MRNQPHSQSTEPELKPDSHSQFGAMIHAARQSAGLSFAQAERVTGVPMATLHGLEQGRTKPKPAVLAVLAKAYGLTLADLYLAAGYEIPKKLPTFQPYLRSRYKDMPTEARDELADAFNRISEKYGYSPNSPGPKPGEDE